MIRLLDILFSILGLFLLLPIFFLVTFISYFDTGSPFLIQKRVGKNLNPFMLIKFRTMKVNTSFVATHLVNKKNITNFGYFLRKFKIDEFLQLWNVLIGDMSLVGPRPCLFNQKRLISERKKKRIFIVKPGITGLAQVKGITMATPNLLAKTDLTMIRQISLSYYFYYIFLSFLLIFKKTLK